MTAHPTDPPGGWVLTDVGTVTDNLDSRRIPLKRGDRAKRQGPFPYYGASGIIDHVDGFLFEGEHLLIAEDGANLASRSTPIAFIANVSLLYILLTRRYGAMWDTPMITMFLRIGAAACVMGAVAYGAYLRLAVWMGVETLFARFVEVAAIILISSVVYFGLCFIFGVDEARRFANVVRRKA